MSKVTVNSLMVAQIARAIRNRVLIYKQLPDTLDYNWKVEDKHMLREWDRWFDTSSSILDLMEKVDIIGMEESDFNKFSYFVYFFWFFVFFTIEEDKRDDKDKEFIAGCTIYLEKYIGKKDEVDMVGLFYKAFPDSKKRSKK